jgi:hypothetical protein
MDERSSRAPAFAAEGAPAPPGNYETNPKARQILAFGPSLIGSCSALG